ncbi:ABC transporter ATP-binding protein [Corynebacterium callunae]|uniref:ABC transporter transmembrane domain-containing protein n=1 Tax=Corynebacterium callunae TaxID=1721 RepID=UPI0039827E11
MTSSQATGAGILKRSIKRQWKNSLIGAAFLGLWQLSEALVPIAIGLIVDHTILNPNLSLFGIGLVGFALLFVVLSFSYRFGARALNVAINFEAHALRVEVAEHALKRLAAKDLVPGEVMSRSTADADSATRVFGQIGTGVSAATGFIGAAGYLLFTDWLVGLVVLALAPVISGIVAFASRGISQRSSTQQEALAAAGAQVGDIMSGLRVLKAIGGEHWANQAYRQASQKSASAAISTARAAGKVAGVGELSIALNLALVLLVAGWRVTTGELNPGELIAIIGVAVYLSEPIRLLSNSMKESAIAHGAAARIAEFLNSAATTQQTPDLELKKGAFVVLEPGTLELPASHEQVLIAPHRADIFEGSIRSNIALSHDPEIAVSSEIIAAAGIQELNLDTPIHDAGSNLSGGQRQRLALARALYTESEVLILQDPTSAVDSVTEVAIAAGIYRLRQGKTTLVFSSSPAFKSVADEVKQ